MGHFDIHPTDFKNIIACRQVNGKFPLTVGRRSYPRLSMNDVDTIQILAGLKVRNSSGQSYHISGGRLVLVSYLIDLVSEEDVTTGIYEGNSSSSVSNFSPINAGGSEVARKTSGKTNILSP